MKELQYDCTCWGCTLPQWLPDSVLNLASEAYTFRNAFPVMRNVIQGKWHTCRNAPDVIVESLWQGWFESSDQELNARVQSDAEEEYKLRLLKQEREK